MPGPSSITPDAEHLLRLLLVPGLGHTRLARLLQAIGSPAGVLAATTEQWMQVQGIGKTLAERALHHLASPQHDAVVRAELDLAEQMGVRLLPITDPAYPKLLSLIPDPPQLLWVKGQLTEADATGLAIVGARKCTHYGREQAERFGFAAADAGLTVISGGAYGIDIHAHHGALKATEGRTIAVLGSGLNKPYPDPHRKTFDQIADSRGALLSELPLNTPPRAEQFLPRNRIISGLSLGVLVIEAAKRSGALNTARQCVDDHNRELMVLPGRVDSAASAGCHHVLREGWGTLVTHIGEVLEQLGYTGTTLAAADEQQHQPAPQASSSQQALLEALHEPRTLDELVAATGLPVHTLQADLTLLEIRGQLHRRAGLFQRK